MYDTYPCGSSLVLDIVAPEDQHVSTMRKYAEARSDYLDAIEARDKAQRKADELWNVLAELRSVLVGGLEEDAEAISR